MAGSFASVSLYEIGTVKLGRAWRAGPGWVGSWDELASRQVALRRAPLPAGGDQPSGLALLSLPAQPTHGRGDAGRLRHHRHPRDGAAAGPQVRPGVRQPDPPEAALRGRQMASR